MRLSATAQTLAGERSASRACVRVRWSRGSERVNVDGAGVLTTGSVGVCESAEGVAQGSAVVLTTQAVVCDD